MILKSPKKDGEKLAQVKCHLNFVQSLLAVDVFGIRASQKIDVISFVIFSQTICQL